MNQRRVSEQLVRLVQIIFGFVLAQSLGRYSDVVIAPFAYEHRVALVALVGVYFTTVMSWIDWHPTMEANPYNMSSKNPHRKTEVLRIWFDLGVVSAYAYLLFSIEPFKINPQGDIGAHLIGYPIVFGLYLGSGQLRRRAYGKFASYLSSIIVFGILLTVLAITYNSINWATVDLPWVRDEPLWGNLAALSSAILLMVLYRYTRAQLRTRRNQRKEQGLKVGFDVDGVLGNQIAGVIPRVKRRHGIDLKYEDVTDWRLPIGESSIDHEILAAMDDPDYLLYMPVHVGALT